MINSINSKETKIAIIIGTRAELIKTFPLMIELQKNNLNYYFIHTGQHNLRDLCLKFKVKTPDVILTKEPKESSKFFGKQIKGIFWNLNLIFKLRKELRKLKNIKYVFYHGDTMTTASAAIASSKLLNPNKTYKNIHLEAGLRSFDLKEPFPEEISRIIADKFSDILFAVSERSSKNLEKYRFRKKVINIGNTILDSVKFAYQIAKKNKTKPLSNRRFVLISIHRHENIKNRERMRKIIKILNSLEIESYFTLHDNTKRKIEEFGLMEKLKENKNIKIIEPLDYLSYIYQLSKCSLIICDGGSLQEESLIFKKPCIILRNKTERPEGLQTNFQFLSKFNIEKTKEKIREYLNPKFRVNKFNNPYGYSGVSKKIIRILR
jgi:UDP-N-acetylglucosamine 2-epimerase (non-hydrolysing)